jgi:dTDP-4-dehydrorhamnose reductase
MRVIVVGGKGQLGRALMGALTQHGHEGIVWDVPEVDITKPEVSLQVAEVSPDALINAAAWTNVDAAESNPHATFAVNSLGPRYLGEGCEACGAFMLQVSTNEVFPGVGGRFYFEYDQPGPMGVYARSKLAGEIAAAATCRRLVLVRLAWLFGLGGNNFPTKIVDAADRLGALRVVSDEFGNPTSAQDAADAMVRLLEWRRAGVYHIVNEGYASRLELAAEVLQASGRGNVPLTPIASADWVRTVHAPSHAVIVNQAAAALGIQLRPWQEAAREYAATLRNREPSASSRSL